MKKKSFIIPLVLTMALVLGACGKKAEATPEILKLSVENVKLGEYKGLPFELEEVTEQNIDDYITNNLLAENATFEKITDGTVKDGDTVNINYVGKKDGVAFEGGTDDSEKGYNLKIGSGSFIEGFEEGLVGAKVGDTLDLNLTFPEDYGKEDLNGAAVVFTVTVNYIQGEQKLPELTDAFVAEKTEYKTIDELKEFVKETLTEQNRTAAENKIFAAAVDNAEIASYPQEYMDEALKSMMNYYTGMASYYQMDVNTVLGSYGTSEETFNEDMKDAAKMFVADKMVALAIADAEGIEITDEIYKEKTDEYIKDYGYESLEAMEETVTKDKIQQQIYADLGRQLVIDNAAK